MFLVIIIYSLLVMTHGLKLPAKCFLLIIKLLGCIVQSLEIYIHFFGCSCKEQGRGGSRIFRGGLNIEVISEAGDLGGCAPQKL